MTQGRGDGKEWLTSFTVSYSTFDVNQWQYVTDQYGNRKVSRSPSILCSVGSTNPLGLKSVEAFGAKCACVC